MNVLPRFLYLFQSIPVFLTKSFFKSVDKLISSFLWGNKHPRVRKELFQRHRAEGGLALPNLMFYYWAANLQKIVYWIQDPNADWCQSEANNCISSSLPALVTTKLPLSPKRYSTCPIVTTTLRIWSQFRQHFNLTDFSVYGPICKNHIFLPANLDTVFAQWQRAGLDKFSDLYIDGIFADFNTLSAKFKLKRSNLFRYFQVRHFIQTISPSFPNLPPRTGLDAILKTPAHLKGLISQIYNTIISFNKVTLETIRAHWAEELGMELSDDTWDGALGRVNGTTSCARLGLIQFKVLHRAHYSKARLSKIYPNVDDTCDRCHMEKADLTHMFWSCDGLRSFWATIFQTLSEAFHKDVQPSAEMAIFGVPGEGIAMANKIKDVFSFATLLARRRILLEWKSAHPPKPSVWLNDLMLFLRLEKIKYSIRGSTKKFHTTWDPLLFYFDRLKTLPQN